MALRPAGTGDITYVAPGQLPIVPTLSAPFRYNAAVITRGIRRFVSRDWETVRESKDAYWAERITRLGPLEAFRVADDLRRQALAQNPAWPDNACRQADLLAHARLAELFHRASATRGR